MDKIKQHITTRTEFIEKDIDSTLLNEGGGDLFLLIINGTLVFVIQNNLSLLFLGKINWR